MTTAIAQVQRVPASSPYPVKVKKTGSFYLAQLDGVRTVAFLMVFLHHADAIPSGAALAKVYNCFVPWGFAGVDLFFVLSGFLITVLLLEEKTTAGDISFKHFFMRRALRIWPLYFLTLFLAAAVIPSFLHQVGPRMYRGYLMDEILPSLFFVGNFAMIQTQWLMGVFAQAGLPTMTLLAPLWSLSVEEQFYMSWPNLVRRLQSPRGMYTALLAFALLSVFAKAVIFCLAKTHNWSHTAYYINTFTRLEPIAIGSAIAVTYCYYRERLLSLSRYVPLMLLLVGLSATLIAFTFPPMTDKHASIIVALPLIALAFGALVICALVSKTTGEFFKAPWMVHVGKLTYSMYLFHAFILHQVKTYFHQTLKLPRPELTWLLCTVVALLGTYLLARLTWALIEQPCLKLKTRFARV